MKRHTLLLCTALLLSMLTSACGPQTRRLRQDQVLDIAWRALEPSTSSQNRGNWAMIEASKVTGRQVVDQFSVLNPNPCPGPLPPENLAIRASSEYWYIRAMPSYLLNPTAGAASPDSGEKRNPEPLLNEALFLIDPFSGQVVARRFTCSVEALTAEP